MKTKLLLIINVIGLAIFVLWYIETRDWEPLAAIVLGIGALITLLWRERQKTSPETHQELRAKKVINSPLANKVGSQTINYFSTDPELIKKIDQLTERIEAMSKDDKKSIVNITSHNQSGGITAHTVNLGPQDRVLSDNAASQLDTELSKHPGKKISVTSVLGDPEAFKFATQIMVYLKEQGYDVDGVNQAVYTAPVRGQHIRPTDDKVDIIIGAKEN